MQPENDETIFYSIGENCLGHGVLARHGLNVQATPFSHSRSNIDYVTQILETNGTDLLNPAFIRLDERHRTKLPINTIYECEAGLFDHTVSSSFEFSHHDVINTAAHRQSYERKLARFLGSLDITRRVCFVYHHRDHARKNVLRVSEKLARFKALCADRAAGSISVVMFTQEIVGKEGRRGISFTRPNGIPTAVLRTAGPWAGTDNDAFWAKYDDDLFARAIGAFSYHAEAEAG